MAKNTRNYPKSNVEELKETIRKLKSQVRNLRKTIEELKTDNRTLREAWFETEDFLKEMTQSSSLEDLLDKPSTRKK